MSKNWFWTKMYSCKFSQKLIVKKIQIIGSNIFFLIEMKIIHICNLLTINFYENWQEYFFVQNQFLFIKNYKIKKYHQCWQICNQKHFSKKEGVFYRLFFSVNVDGIYLYYHFLWFKTDSEQKYIPVNFHKNW